MVSVLPGFSGHVPGGWVLHLRAVSFFSVSNFSLPPNTTVAIKRIFPNAKLLRSGSWAKYDVFFWFKISSQIHTRSPFPSFNATYSMVYMIEPTDPVFIQVADVYYSLLLEAFGTDHVYNAGKAGGE